MPIIVLYDTYDFTNIMEKDKGYCFLDYLIIICFKNKYPLCLNLKETKQKDNLKNILFPN